MWLYLLTAEARTQAFDLQDHVKFRFAFLLCTVFPLLLTPLRAGGVSKFDTKVQVTKVHRPKLLVTRSKSRTGFESEYQFIDMGR